MGADNIKPSVNLAQQADNDLRKKYDAEKADHAAKDTVTPQQSESEPTPVAPESAQRS